MPLEYHKEQGQLVWVRNPFNGTITYYTDIQRKRSGFVMPPPLPATDDAQARHAAEEAMRAELETARQECPFCPGNEHLTTEEVMRIRPGEIAGTAATASSWLIRVIYNIVPRIPEQCTGGRNESYVIIEDPRHFADDARHREDLLYTAILPATQFEAILRTNVEVARIAYLNPAVQAALIRKNQGRESGASQPHVHNQVIGSGLPFPPIVHEQQTLLREPGLWHDILAWVEDEGYMIERRDGFFLYFCPFGAFPRSYEIVCPDMDGRITDVPADRLSVFASLLHRALEILGPLPIDYEIHDGPGIPLHAHVSARHYPYSNIGGTLNLPTNRAWNLPAAAG